MTKKRFRRSINLVWLSIIVDSAIVLVLTISTPNFVGWMSSILLAIAWVIVIAKFAVAGVDLYCYYNNYWMRAEQTGYYTDLFVSEALWLTFLGTFLLIIKQS